MTRRITHRPGSDSDLEFLYLLLKRSLGPHVEATYGPWDEQWQRTRFLETTDPSEHRVVEFNGQPIGCMLVEETSEALQLHRVLLLPEHQNRGIGSTLVHELVERAVDRGKPVRLQVFRVSPAVRFYARLGFRPVGETETHVLMEYAA